VLQTRENINVKKNSRISQTARKTIMEGEHEDESKIPEVVNKTTQQRGPLIRSKKRHRAAPRTKVSELIRRERNSKKKWSAKTVAEHAG